MNQPKEYRHPPRWAVALLRRCCPPWRLEEVEGDLAEIFTQRLKRHGLRRAQAVYWREAMLFCLWQTRRRREGYQRVREPILLGNYLTVSLRHLRRHSGYVAINLVGLAMGMACFLLIMLFVREQLRYDQFHVQADRVYRLSRYQTQTDGGHVLSTRMPAGLGPALVQDFPEIEAAVRCNLRDDVLIGRIDDPERRFYENGFLMTDSSFFEVFSFPLLRGTPATALARPDALVLTESMARRYFGDADPLGQVIQVENAHGFVVTGVVTDPPATSSIQFNFLAPFDARRVFTRDPGGRFAQSDTWSILSYPTYVLLTSEAETTMLAAKLPGYVQEKTPVDIRFYRDAESGDLLPFRLEPLTAVYHSAASNPLGPRGDLRYVYVISTIALLLLLVAVINYMNLATARSAERAHEVGVRKVVGAGRRQLVGQFLGEAVLLCVLALPLALLIAHTLLPAFNRFMDTHINVDYLGDVSLLLVIGGSVVVLGLLSGSYPAAHLSRFRPVAVLKGGRVASTSGTRLRKALVVLQFVVSVALIATTFGIQAQLRFIRTKQLGLEQERLVVVPIRDTQVAAQPFAFKEAVLDQAHVARVSVSSSVPLRGFGFDMPVSSLQVDDVPVTLYTVDPDFVATYGLEMARGRGFPEASTMDASWMGMLNETAVRRLQMDDLDEQMVYLLGRRQIEVAGIVKDFHYQSLHQEVGPLLLQPLGERHRQTMTNYVSVKLRPGDPAAALDALEAVWHRFAPDEPFQYFFLDQAFDQLYKSEERLARMFNAFAILAILIGCLGLFGLAAYTTQQRTKELSIRKVLGASVWELILLLLQDVVKLIGLAFGIAVPLAYMGLERWLQDFAYRVSPGIALFALAGGLALGIALLTVGYQTVRAALTNPVEALRYE